ncbi:MAG: proprotein convertase P-domain-containing protein [Halobacteriales archaeon]|nr:proprotein convertase P-domain-containing protein [Halobacteriales archaeon]
MARRALLLLASTVILATGAGLAQTTLVCSADGGSGCNQAIPDDDLTGIESSLTVSSSSCTFGREIDVGVDLHHTWVGDLVVTLTHDSTGTSVDLLDRFQGGGCNGNDVDALFSDGAAAPTCSNTVVPTIHGTVEPVETLFPFRSEGESGTWTLTVVDAAANETGELLDWDLTVHCIPPGITVVPTSGLTTTESGGTAQFEVVLDTVPTGDVTVTLASLDPS